MKLRDNQWGFDLSLDNPFRIFRYLREIAIEKVGLDHVVDLSRGDPGYGYCPSVSGREFYSFLLVIDAFLNYPGQNFAVDNTDDFQTLWQKIQDHARMVYASKVADKLLEKFYFFVTRIEKYSKEQGLDWDKRQVLFQMFQYATVSGGCYHDPQGEVLTRLVVASHHNEKFDLNIRYSDLILMQGVSHGIGTIYKALCDEHVGYLQKGDAVLITSPAYAPYITIMENRGLQVYPVSMDAINGTVNGDLEEILRHAPERTKLICIIDPNNPTGFMFEESFLQRIAKFAEEKNAMIISDEVYSDFFFARKKSMLNFAKKRTVVMTGRSKIERNTGLRFGEYIVPQETDEYISKHILNGKLDGHPNLKSLLISAKAPGGIKGEFQHVTFVTGPSQFLGISHVIFGDDDRTEYLRRIRVNMENFYEILGLPYYKNFYYATIDLLSVPGCTKGDDAPEQLFLGLASKGVVLIPANLFFSQTEREQKDYRSYARASLANLNFTQLQEAARRMKEYLRS